MASPGTRPIRCVKVTPWPGQPCEYQMFGAIMNSSCSTSLISL
jgi:hypothetical protein